MACNFSQLRRRQSSGSLNKGKTDDDFKDQFYRSVSGFTSQSDRDNPPNVRDCGAGHAVLESMKGAAPGFRRYAK